MSDLDARVVDLELRFMKLERFTEELSDVIAAQGRTIEALVAEGKELRARLLASTGPLVDEKPPHY